MFKYQYLLSPIKINNVVLKNRMIASNSLPHFLQGQEEYPAESIIKHLSGIARNGASIVTFADWSDKSLRKFSNGDICRFPVYDLENPATVNYMNQLTDSIHFYGSKVSIALSPKAPQGFGVYENKDFEVPSMFKEMLEEEDMPSPFGNFAKTEKGQKLMLKMMSKPRKGENMPPLPFTIGPVKEISEEQMQEIIDGVIKTITYYKNCGFDMCTLHMAYRSTLLANFLSPLTNRRTDKYGGCLENRARFPLMMCRQIKEKFGKDFLIEAQISGEDGIEGGNTIDDIVNLAKLSEGLIDIIQLRAGDADDAHPTGFNSIENKPLTIKYAEAIKKANVNIVTEPIGGFQNPEELNEYIKEGKTDMIGMARAFICDFEYGKKIYEGRGEDIVPCIRCNKCHGVHMDGPYKTVCSVNPKMGLQNYLEFLESKSVSKEESKNIAIIGGGPAGMQSAIILCDKGHNVTIYEKSSQLGGAISHSDYVSFKWPLRNYKNYLINQVNKRNIDVKLNNEIKPNDLKEKNYDAILVAMGAKPIIPKIKGILHENGNLCENIYTYSQVYNNKNLGSEIIVIGGGDVGVETALYLAENNYNVKILSFDSKIAPTSNRVHYYSMLKKYFKNTPNVEFIKKSNVIEVTRENVIYKDAQDEIHKLNYDSIVLCCGMKENKEEALEFAGISPIFYIIGDNEKVGSIETSTRSAYGIANTI